MDSQSIATIVRKHAELKPNKPAVITPDITLNYSELVHTVSQVKSLFQQAGISSGDHVGVVLPNCAEFVVLLLVASEMELTLVPHSSTLTPESLDKAFCATDTKHFVVWHTLVEPLKESFNGQSSESVWITVGEYSERKSEKGCLTFACRTTNRIDQNNSEPCNGDIICSDSSKPYILTMTSGSTGEPKPIALTQENKLTRAEMAAKLYRVTENAVVLAATPLYHSLAQRLVILPLIQGATAVVMQGFTPEKWMSAIERHQVTFTIAVSSQLAQIYDKFSVSDHDLSSLQCIVSSSERLDDLLKDRLVANLQCEFHECYGASEVAIVSDLDVQNCSNNPHSVGKPIMGVDIKILNDELRELPTGEVGEIVCKTPMLFSGYYKKDQLTESSMWNGYFKTGDLGFINDQGYLYYTGRKKDLIIVGGINVFPKDIESAILNMPEIKECAVIAMPHDQFNEVPLAVVVPDNNERVTERQVLRQCVNSLADFQLPHKIVVLKALPRNAMGKVQKSELIKLLFDNQDMKIA